MFNPLSYITNLGGELSEFITAYFFIESG